MIIKEYEIRAEFFQEVSIPETSNILRVVIKSEGEVVLLVEASDKEDFIKENRVVGIYIVSTDDMKADQIPDNYMYLDTLRMASEFGVILFHVYMEAIDLSDLFNGDYEEPMGGCQC